MKKVFEDIGLTSYKQLYYFINSIKTSTIRTEADEIQYNLHIIMRYDFEKELFRGNLNFKDLESAWNDRYLEDFNNKPNSCASSILSKKSLFM